MFSSASGVTDTFTNEIGVIKKVSKWNWCYKKVSKLNWCY